MNGLGRWLLACALTVSSAAHGASRYDVADLWWNPDESGWGIQLVQQHRTVFATMFVYDRANAPTWYTATLRLARITENYGPIFTGPVYATRGPHWASGHASPVQSTEVGTMTFSSSYLNHAVLTYTIDGITVTKEVRRQTLVYESFTGSYRGLFALTMTGCDDPSDNGSLELPAQLTIDHDDAAMYVRASLGSGASSYSCSFNGTFYPAGNIGMFQSTYQCSTGETGSLLFAEMRRHGFAISGWFVDGHNNRGCKSSGRFAAME